MFFRGNRTRRDQNGNKFGGQNPALLNGMRNLYYLRMVFIRMDSGRARLMRVRRENIVAVYSGSAVITSDVGVHQRRMSLED